MEKITDYISGQEIQNKPEEIDAVQPFSKRLVEDYGYPKSHICLLYTSDAADE